MAARRGGASLVIPGVSGQLISHAFLDRELLPALLNSPDAIHAGARTRALDRWWRLVTVTLGPASAARAVLDVAVVPLLDLLGHGSPLMTAEDWGLVGVTESHRGARVLVVSVPWLTTIDSAWQRALRLGLADRARWSLVSNGQSLRIVDCARPWARLAVEFQFAALLRDPRGAIVLSALANHAALTERSDHGDSLMAIVARSGAYSSHVCRALGRGVLTALQELTNAFGPSTGSRPSARTGAATVVFDQALTMVYRVLFLLFAEARGLVPVWHETYREAYTIDALCRRIGERPGAPGLWAALQAISRMAHTGCRTGDLEVTAFNGRLFSPAHAPLVEQRRVPDAIAQRVVMALATAESSSIRSRIAYHDLGVEQLGSVYEQVLEYEVEPSAAAFALRSTSTERKTSGSFYTPRSVTEFLVRRTLQPLVEGRSAEEILSLRVLDPAMGSGAFLVAACQFLADQCERALVRDGPWSRADVSAAERAAVRRAVAERCLYGVDRNPTAVQLARLSLWLTTLATDRPLTFLDHHLAAGDSLLGAGLSDLARPFAKHRTRDPSKAAPLLPLFEDEAAGVVAERILPERVRLALDPSDTPQDVRQKERRLAALQAPDGPFSKWARALDVWCALHSWPGTSPSPALSGELIAATLGAQTTLPTSQLGRLLAQASSIARERHAFHWEIEFPEAFFDRDGRPRPDAGFDAVIGNPPWDVLRADTGSAAARASDRPRTESLLRFFRESGIYRQQGHGHSNSYQLFVERTMQLTRPGGRFGLIVPSGLATDHGSARLRRALLERSAIDTWLGFTNRATIFPIHRSVRFILLAGSKEGSTERLTFRSGLSDAAMLERRPSSAREDSDNDAVSIARARLEAWDPEHLTIPEITSAQMLRILTHLYTGAPALSSPQGWGATFGRELNATDDRRHFVSASSLGPSPRLPVLEGKHLSPFQTSLSAAQQTIPIGVAARLIDPASSFRRIRLAYRDVASATNRLTLIAALLPRNTISTHTVFCLKTLLSMREQWCLLALLNSLLANYLIRARVTTHVTATMMARLPVPRPPAHSAAFHELVTLARSLARTGIDANPDAYARLNAVVAALYQLTPEDYGAIVDTFPLLPAELRSLCIGHYVQATGTQRLGKR
jgi:Eco57I restriction-modification methylase